MNKRPSFDAFKKEAMEDKKFRAEYELLGPEFELIRQFIVARKKARYTQSKLAKKLKIQQPSIVRLEKGGYSSASITTLSRVADALGYSMKISLEPKKRK